MRWKKKQKKWYNHREWHSKFAWFPIRIDSNTIVFLEKVERRNTMSIDVYNPLGLKRWAYR